MERLLKTLLNQSLSQPLNRSRSTGKCLGDTLVRPVRSVSVGLQQNLSTPNFLARSLQLLDNIPKLLPFLIRQTHHVQLLHGIPPCATQHDRFARFCQPDILAVTKDYWVKKGYEF